MYRLPGLGWPSYAIANLTCCGPSPAACKTAGRTVVLGRSAIAETTDALLKRFADFYRQTAAVEATYNATIKISSVEMDLTTS